MLAHQLPAFRGPMEIALGHLVPEGLGRIGPMLSAAILIPFSSGCLGPGDQAPLAEPGLAMAAATVPEAFSDELVASGLASPTAMEVAPDGRIFISPVEVEELSFGEPAPTPGTRTPRVRQ